MYLSKINGPKDVKKIPLDKLPILANEMRSALLNKLSCTGGHVSPNFGMVEATIALHYVFNSPIDKIVFDVSHQSYPHKLLTGRAINYLDEKHFNDITGYTSQKESKHDLFTIGHTSTSISLAIGLAKARDLKKEHYNVISIIGDGSLSGGEALEGLSAAYELNSNFIIVVNDNNMCMAENHGGLYKGLKILRDTNGKSANNIFKFMGYDYIFVKDGNKINEVISAFKKAKDHTKPIVVHLCTTKGKGLSYAEKDKEYWHSQSPFDPLTGQLKTPAVETYNTIIRDYILSKAKKDKKFCAVTSATPIGAGLRAPQRKQLGKQFIDVGIAEQTAAAVCSGMATNGGKPLWTIGSSFVQRAYDQLSQDVGINKSPIAMCIVWTGLYGMNDVTHLGWFDIPLISNIPNIVYICPYTKQEFLKALEYAVDQNAQPTIVRAPGGRIVNGKPCNIDFSKTNKYYVSQKGQKVAFIGLGYFQGLAINAAKEYFTQTKIKPTVINPYFASGIDRKLLNSLISSHDIIVTLEDGVINGGWGEKISRFYGTSKVKVLNYGIKKEFVDHFDVNQIAIKNKLTPKQIVEDILKLK